MRFAAVIVAAAFVGLSACDAPPVTVVEDAKEEAAPVAKVYMDLPVGPSAQDELFAYLVAKAGASAECSEMPADNEYCHPKPVTVEEQDARHALAYMSNVDDLMAPCIAGDGESCFTQRDYGKLAGQLGWCRRTSLGRDASSVVLWARCEERGTIIIHEAQ
jgi:hypothetical protein